MVRRCPFKSLRICHKLFAECLEFDSFISNFLLVLYLRNECNNNNLKENIYFSHIDKVFVSIIQMKKKQEPIYYIGFRDNFLHPVK